MLHCYRSTDRSLGMFPLGQIMATAEQVKALIASFAEGDRERFLSVAIQVAATEAKKGHSKAAQELRALVDSARKGVDASRLASPIPIARPKGELADLLTATFPSTKLHSLVVSEDVLSHLEKILNEQRHSKVLREHGLTPRHKVLLVGPPGTGKTLSASAIAGELGLPLFVVRLDGLVTKFMGETSAKLRLVFDAVSSTRGVYLFDEFDGIGTSRLGTNDVGEARRIVTSFLQMVEQDNSASLIVAATNHVESLDPALFRRFDDVIHFELPTPAQIEALLIKRLGRFLPTLELRSSIASATGLSHAEISQACDDVIKESIIKSQGFASLESLGASLDRKRYQRKQR